MIFEEYIKLLESFKQNQISKILERIDTKIFDILYSKHVSPRIATYFPHYELCFMADDTQLEPGKLYVRELNGKIAYSVITPQNETVKDVILEDLDAPAPFKYKIKLTTEGINPKKGTFYVRKLETGLEYTVIDPQGKLITDVIKKQELNINLASDFTPKDLEPFLPEITNIASKKNHSLPFTLDAFKARILSAASRRGHTQWAPFKNYDLDPDNISQIKKLINALYYARLTFLDLENVDVRNIKRSYTDLRLLYGKTIDLAYEASYLLTHLDVDLKDMFDEELALILPLFGQIQSFAQKHFENKKGIVQALEPKPLAYKAGEIAGITIDQLRPNDDVDFNFLTQFSAVLPSYIDKLTHYIEQFSSQIKESEPKLNQKKLAELQNAALNLLNDIENIKGNSVFVSVKFLNYIHIISNIITLSMSTLEQIGELSESSQDLVRDKLGQLKYIVLPTLFGLVDKIEDNAMLKPGTLSVPLMEKVKVLYEKILYLPQKAIDFKKKGANLLEIEDPHFIELRLEMTYRRIDKANKALYKIQKANAACRRFFTILKDPQYSKLRLYQLPDEVKEELVKNYKLLKPYMAQLDIDLNSLIISRLTGPAKEDWYSYIGTPLRWVKKQLPADHISFVLAKESALNNLITKDENSKIFHINLNKDLIDSVHKKANLVLFPYRGNEKTSVYAVDESIPLHVEQVKDKKSRLKKKEFELVQMAYLHFVQIIKEQIAANPDLYNKNLALNNLGEKERNECHQLFKIFQPYLNSIVAPEFKDSAKNFELYLVGLFAEKENLKTPSKEFFLNLDNNVRNFFDFINFQWFDKNEFQKILNAYSQFSQIIKKQIEEQPQHYGNNLVLTSLDEGAKQKCYQLFQIFQPYFKLAIPRDLQASALNFEKYLTAFLTNKPVELLEAPPVSLFLKLDKPIQDFFAEWKDKSQTYYDFAKGKFLDEKESKALDVKREEDAKLHFKTVEGDKLLQNYEQLTADQTLEIYQWYRNKHNKFLVVHNAYTQFLKLLDKEIKAKPEIQENISLLNQIRPGIKAQLRNLYSIFQPYLINAVPSEHKEDALSFDEFLVDSLSTTQFFSEDAPPIEIFLDLKSYFQDVFIRFNSEWNRRTERFFNLAQEKFILENNSTALKPDPTTGREHFVIQHTNYSKCIHEFRQSLFEITKLFNQSMQAELTPNLSTQPVPGSDLSAEGLFIQAWQTVLPPSKAPFPEMEDNNKRLAQSRQVCALKDIYNSLFHLEGIVLELENLNNKSIKSRYVYYLLQAYGHLNEIIKSAKRLAADPHLGFLARDLLDKAQTIYATFQEHSDAYQVGPEQISFGPAQVQYNALWYVLNAFYITPKHIRAFKNTNYLTTAELNELHFKAKKSTSFIEGLINNSNSYFKLFLQTPNMIYLYQELTAKLNEFTSTSHDAVMDNIEKIQSEILTPMLLEADHWENRLGLSPGILSGPLRQITNEFFKGLLHPLDLDSKTRIGLIYDKKQLEKRTSLTKKQINRNQKYIKKIDKDFQDIEHLYHWYLEVTTPIDVLDFSVPIQRVPLDKAKTELCAAYKKALPKLAQLKQSKKVEIPPSMYAEDHKLDELCNSGLKSYDPHFTEIEALIVASHHYYLGLKATHQMRLNTVQEKLDYLTDLEPIEAQEKQLFVEQYTTDSFKKHLETTCNSSKALQYLQYNTDKEYRDELHAYLQNLQKEIIAKSKNSRNIDRSIKKLLEIETRKFEKKYYADYYHLFTVRAALEQFKIYFSSSRLAIHNHKALFESDKTLDMKSERIKELEAIANNQSMEVHDRLQEIEKKIKDPNFGRIIMAHKQMDTFSFTYLKICFFSLLEALNLFTPTRKILLGQINAAVTNQPKMSELTKRLGLFATNKPDNDLETKRYEAPILPVLDSNP